MSKLLARIGQLNHMRTFFYSLAAFALASVLSSHVAAAESEAAPDIHFIWMGGNDCPACVAWRAFELPKLQQSQEFKFIRFSYVVKGVKSSVPPRIFLPSEVVPLKEKLDEASGGRAGSPKGALVVNGEIYDFFQGARTAQEIESMIHAVRTGTAYPFKRCLRAASNSRKCEIAA